MENLVPKNLTFSEVGYRPIIKDFAKKIKLVETLDDMVDSEMELSPGIAILALAHAKKTTENTGNMIYEFKDPVFSRYHR